MCEDVSVCVLGYVHVCLQVRVGGENQYVYISKCLYVCVLALMCAYDCFVYACL